MSFAEHGQAHDSLPQFTIDALLAHQGRQQRQALSMGIAWSNALGLVFTTVKGTPLHEVNVSRYFHRMLAKAGVQQIRFYDLRHTRASLLIAQGVHARVIMDLLGHSDIAVTMNTYAHIMQASRHEAAKSMQALLYLPDDA